MFTGEDFRDTALRARSALPGYVETAQPVLAAGKARFAGEAVAAVVADSRYLAEDEDGNLSTGSLLDYLMPTSAEIPELVIGHVAYPAANPLGVRGVGEGGTLGPAAALAGAVGDAVGVAVDRLPITPSSLWELMTP